jgi:hypothetical protein
VGHFRLWESAKLMIKRYFQRFMRPEAACLSDSQFRVCVEALYGGRRELLLGAEPVEDQWPVTTQRSGDLLHWLKT